MLRPKETAINKIDTSIISRALIYQIIIIILIVSDEVAAQVSLPPVNLGETSILDGVAGPGWLFQETLTYSSAPRFRDGDGDRVRSPDHLETFAAITQIAHISEYKLFGAFVGAEVLLPLAYADLDVDPMINGSDFGVSDLVVGPLILQWSDTFFLGRPFYHRLNFNFTLPTGEYDSDELVSPGQNTIRFNPHYAFTWMASDTWEISGRLHYLWNAENDDPPANLDANSIQAGQAVHANVSVSKAVTDQLRLGLSGYVLEQITDDQIDGADIPNSRERIVGFGPAFRLQLGRSALFANAYIETAARDRPEGSRFFLRWQTVF